MVEKLAKRKFRTYKLTQGEYYQKTGMNKAKEKSAKWINKNKTEWDISSNTSPITANPNQFSTYLNNYLSVYNTLWNARLNKKWTQ
mmetsp:Transcript_20745/g.31133  ORF Transcript_20745/g.31133 Transcript_20745/m.31133 type:complete len:86 (+) Transcript_20745:457-714(+)